MNNKPLISIIVAARNMERELPRTLHTLTPAYQLGIEESDYEVIVVDVGSTVPIDLEFVRGYGINFTVVPQHERGAMQALNLQGLIVRFG